MVKFASNFCYCAVNQETAVFKWKRSVSGPSAFLGPEMVKFAQGYSRDALAKPSVEGPCRALHAEGYPLPERIPKMIGHEG